MARHPDEHSSRSHHETMTPQEKKERQQQPQNFLTPAIMHSIADALVIKDWDVFFVVDRDGSVPLKEGHGFGLYYHDCRFLRGYELTMAGKKPTVLASATHGGFKGVFELTNTGTELEPGTLLEKETIGITWERMLRGDNLTLNDEISFYNYGQDTLTLPITLSFYCAFEDIFTVRGVHANHTGNRFEPRWEGDVLGFLYQGGDGLFRSLGVHLAPTPDGKHGTSAHFRLTLPPGERVAVVASITLRESADRNKAEPYSQRYPSLDQVEKRLHETTHEWLAGRTEIRSASLLLERIIDRCLRDLHTLRTRLKHEEFFAAGIPWYGTLFGRDSLITAYQTLAFDAKLAEQTVRLLASYQGQNIDPDHDEEPGKILHELRVGELARMGRVPFSPYYGTVDATPLLLILIAEHAHWSGDLTLFDDMRDTIDAAFSWMDNFGDKHGWGYLTYATASKNGLSNQGWKDSGDAIMNADGSLARPPIALAEVQGYMYMAKKLMAELFARTGDRERATRLDREAADLKERFNREFWVNELGFYAMALEADKKPCKVVGSNPGQALWTGIVDEKRAERVMERLLKEDMYSGWGIRTLSHREKRYNPIGYHLGTVWPHDNSLIAMGFRRYGFDEAVMRVFLGLFEAATHFDQYRIPELISGFQSEPFGEPVRYPVACHPQAWAAGSIPLLMRNLLGLVPEALDGRLRIRRPMLPPFVSSLDLLRLHVGKACLDLRFWRSDGGVHVKVLKQSGPLEVIVEEAPS